MAGEAETSAPGGRASREAADWIALRVLPFGVESRAARGHAWLEWSGTADPHPPYRGYYPDFTDPDVPDECRPGSREFARWIRVHSVRGRQQVDYGRARAVGESHRERIAEWRAPMAVGERAKLEKRCRIPPGQESLIEGRYSWNEEREDWDNCSSWALKVARHAVGASVPPCERPKKLTAVIAALSGGSGDGPPPKGGIRT